MAFERNDIVNKNRLMGELGEELMGFEHNDIVTVDVMNEAIAEGGGGGGDFSTATVTSINNTALNMSCLIPYVIDDPEEGFALSNGEVYFESGTMTTTAILYKGMCTIYLPSEGKTIAISGNIESDGDVNYTITGDCTITISDLTAGESDDYPRLEQPHHAGLQR